MDEMKGWSGGRGWREKMEGGDGGRRQMEEMKETDGRGNKEGAGGKEAPSFGAVRLTASLQDPRVQGRDSSMKHIVCAVSACGQGATRQSGGSFSWDSPLAP